MLSKQGEKIVQLNTPNVGRELTTQIVFFY